MIRLDKVVGDPTVHEGFDQLAGVGLAQFFDGIGVVVLSEKVGEVPVVPAQVLDQPSLNSTRQLIDLLSGLDPGRFDDPA